VSSEHSTHVLVAEDDTERRLELKRVLEEEGHRVVEAADGPAALHALNRRRLDLVVLDLALRGVGAVEVLGRLRRRSGVPVLVLANAPSETKTVQVLDAGADDYLVEPCSFRELAARVRALLRRGTPLRAPEQLECGDLQLDLAARTVSSAGRDVALTAKEFDLLAFLAASPGRTYTRDELLEHVWGSTANWQTPATVTEHVRRLRSKLDRDAGRASRIETVRGVGYRLSGADS
jgi:two-component system phosphate regulon response regulator PhoB